MAVLMMQKKIEGEGNYERQVWESGPAKFKLAEIQAGININKFEDNKAEPSARFVFVDEDGDRLESSAIRFPKGLRYNERSTFWGYVGAIFGRDLTNDDAVGVEIEGVNALEDLDALPQFFKGGERPVAVKSVTINGEEVIGNGKEVTLVLTKEVSEKGNAYNKIKSITPAGVGGKVKKAPPAGAPL